MTNMRCVNGLPKTSLCFKTLQYKKLIWSKIKHCQKFQQKAVWTIWQNLLKSSIILQDTCYGWDIKSGGGWMGPDQSSGISRACSIMHASTAPACCLTERNAPFYFRKKHTFHFLIQYSEKNQSSGISRACSIMHASMAPACCLTQRNAPLYFR